MSFIQNLFTSRDNNITGNTYVGQVGRLWYNPDTNALYVSDGSTVGGIPVGFNATGNGIPIGPISSVQYNAGNGSFGGTANFTYNGTTVSVTGNIATGNILTDNYLYANGESIFGNTVFNGNTNFANISVTGIANLGNLTIFDQTISGTVTDRDVTIATVGNANIEMLGAFHVHAAGNIEALPEFAVGVDGQVTIRVPVVDATLGAVEIIGSTSGVAVPLGNPGGMLHITGQNNEVSRVYNDGVNNYPLYVGRRFNGTATAPTGVLGGQVISRIGANPYLTDTPAFTSLGVAQINFVATQNQTTTAQGSKIVLSVTPTGSNVQATVASFDTSGIELTGNLLPLTDNIYSLGNISRRWIGAYFGNAGIYIQDTTQGTTGSISLDNGILLLDGNIDGLQIGTANSIQLTTDGITVSNPALDINLGTVGDTGNTHILNAGVKFTDGTVQTTAAIPLIQKGAALGVVPLNSATKIDTIYLPSGGPVYQGTWDAFTNTPTLADGTGTAGDLYIVSVAGTQDLGSGSITFAIGDEAVYNGTIWQRVAAGAVGVTSFNTRIGAVTLTSGDVTNALSNGSIVNSKLANSNVTINTGTGLAGGGTVALGGTLTLTASGILNVLGGTGVTVTTADNNATVSIGQPVSTSNSVTFLSVTSNTTVQATGNITGGNLATAGRVVATGNIVTSGYVLTPGTTINSGIVSTGNITGANLITGGSITATGNIRGGNLTTGGQMVAVGNVTANYFIGNGSQLTGIATSNSFSNVYANGTAVLATSGTSILTLTPGNNQVITGNNTSKTVTIAVNDNPTFANITVTGNIFTANTSYLSNIGNILFANTAPLPTAQPGIMEYDGRVLYFTPQDQERGILPTQEWYVLNADRGLTYASTTPQSLFGVGVHVSNSTRYWFRLKATISRAAGTNNTALTLGWRGTAVLTKLNYTAQGSIGAVSTPTSSTTYETTLVSGFTVQNTVTGTSNAPDSTTLVIQGMIDVGTTGGGYVEPFISWTGATAPGSVTVSSLSYFQLFPLGITGANTSVGNWA